MFIIFWDHTCVLKAPMVECWSIPLIGTWSTTDQHSTSRSTVGQESTNFWLMYMSWLTLSRLSTDCWSIVNRVSIEMLIKCWLSVGRLLIGMSIEYTWSMFFLFTLLMAKNLFELFNNAFSVFCSHYYSIIQNKDHNNNLF